MGGGGQATYFQYYAEPQYLEKKQQTIRAEKCVEKKRMSQAGKQCNAEGGVGEEP